MRAEVASVSSDEAVVRRDGELVSYSGLPPATSVTLDGVEVTTLPRPGQRLATVATTNDVHFGETECGRMDGSDAGPIFSAPEGAEPYPAMMSRHVVAEIAERSPDAVVVKGDLTAEGRPEEYAAFLDCYEGTFGERLTHVRGNHDCYEHQAYADAPFQEVTVPGAVVTVLDTCRPGHVGGTITPEQFERLDELGARADRPVIVLGHHPIWDGRLDRTHGEDFGLTAAASDALTEVCARRPRLVTYAAGHTHRNHVREIAGVPYVEVASVKDFPGAWCEYQIYDGGILQVVRRARHPEALVWAEATREMFGGAYGDYALGALSDRCRLIPIDRR